MNKFHPNNIGSVVIIANKQGKPIYSFISSFSQLTNICWGPAIAPHSTLPAALFIFLKNMFNMDV